MCSAIKWDYVEHNATQRMNCGWSLSPSINILELNKSGRVGDFMWHPYIAIILWLGYYFLSLSLSSRSTHQFKDPLPQLLQSHFILIHDGWIIPPQSVIDWVVLCFIIQSTQITGFHLTLQLLQNSTWWWWLMGVTNWYATCFATNKWQCTTFMELFTSQMRGCNSQD